MEMGQQLDLFPVAVHLNRIDPDQHMKRFYRLCLQPDLFGGCVLSETRSFGARSMIDTSRFVIPCSLTK